MLFSDHKPHVEDPHSLFEPLASKRSAETWQVHFDDLREHHFYSIGMASDRGCGLVAGYHTACQDVRWVCERLIMCCSFIPTNTPSAATTCLRIPRGVSIHTCNRVPGRRHPGTGVVR